MHGNPLRYSDPKGLAAQVCLIPGVNVACGAAATAVAEAVGGLALLGGVLSIPGDSAEPQSCPKPAIADVEPGDLCEQLALAEAKAGAGVVIMTALADEPRLISHYGAGPWVKKQHTHVCSDGRKLVIHYFHSLTSGLNVELKFVN